MDTKPQIRIESFIEASPAEVWKAITDKEWIGQWLMETNIEPVKGFVGYFKMKPMPGFDGNITTQVTAVTENELFEYTWQGGWMKNPTAVRFTLRPQASGTLLILEHWGFEGFMGNLLRRMMGNGWKKMVAKRIPALLKARR